MVVEGCVDSRPARKPTCCLVVVEKEAQGVHASLFLEKEAWGIQASLLLMESREDSEHLLTSEADG